MISNVYFYSLFSSVIYSRFAIAVWSLSECINRRLLPLLPNCWRVSCTQQDSSPPIVQGVALSNKNKVFCLFCLPNQSTNSKKDNILKINFEGTHFIYNLMHLFEMHSWLEFWQFTHPCHHYHSKDVEHFHCPQRKALWHSSMQPI